MAFALTVATIVSFASVANAGLIPGSGPTPAEMLARDANVLRATLPVEIEPGVELIDAYADGLDSIRIIELTRAGSVQIAGRVYQTTARQRCADPLAKRLFGMGGRAVAILVDDLGERLQTVIVDHTDCIE